jgi:hypothetical protein
MMAVHKAIRSKSSAQPSRHRPHPQFKAQLFDTFHQLNRGYGIALSALERLQKKARLEGPAIFPAACLRDYRSRTEALQALANRDLLRAFAGHEDQDAAQFAKKK